MVFTPQFGSLCDEVKIDILEDRCLGPGKRNYEEFLHRKILAK